jgi:3-hydroxyacyl-[acyl-carrier-protein] dehydratase
LSDVASIGRQDIWDILKHIPHRYPFLLVDRMLVCEPKRRVHALKNISANDHFFQGVDSRRKVMPQMFVVEALAQVAGVLCHYSGLLDGPGNPMIFLAGIDDCRFGRSAGPGDQLLLECSSFRTMRGIVKMSGTATVGGESILEANLTAAVRQTAETGQKTR